jgi:hypothetical protein
MRTQPLTIEALTLDWPSPGELRFSGTLTTISAHTALEAFLRTVHGAIVDEKRASFTADVRGLHFVNSSVIRLFVAWITWAERASYRLSFLTDASTTWQRVSFSALKAMAPGTVDIIESKARI